MTYPINPDLDGFRRAAESRRVISVHTKVIADNFTPVSLYHQLCGTRPNTFLLESADNGIWSRYSFVGVAAAATLSEKNGEAFWSGREIIGLPTGGDPLAVLGETLRTLHTPADPALPPLVCGMVGYLGYDTVRRVELLPDSNPDDLHLPELMMMLVTEMAVFDHQNGDLWLVATAVNYDNSGERVDAAHADAVQRVRAMVSLLQQPAEPLVMVPNPEAAPAEVHRQRTSAEFEACVRSCVAEIMAGEAFQIVVSQRFDLPCSADALDVYRVLRRLNPSPYLYLLRFADWAIVGSSPEALVTVQDGQAVTHPIAGTRPRGQTRADDLALETELLADPKEKAEHLMLVDLGRNDLGRVCVPGTVTVVEFMAVRRYSHVMHLEATVTGTIAAGRSALDVTMACFPAGTLSGAPKVRAMEIIDALEVSRRGVYGGVVGYFDFAGNSDMAIAIRTAVLAHGRAWVQSGAGVVADSVPHNEDLETRNKAMAAIRAVQIADSMQRLTGQS